MRPIALTPIGKNPLGFFNLVLGPGEAELHFAGAAGDDDFDRGQTAALHSQVELFMSFMRSMALEAVHGSASAARHPKAMTNVAGQFFNISERVRRGAGCKGRRRELGLKTVHYRPVPAG